jgi:hypothetical protein
VQKVRGSNPLGPTILNLKTRVFPKKYAGFSFSWFSRITLKNGEILRAKAHTF